MPRVIHVIAHVATGEYTGYATGIGRIYSWESLCERRVNLQEHQVLTIAETLGGSWCIRGLCPDCRAAIFQGGVDARAV